MTWISENQCVHLFILAQLFGASTSVYRFVLILAQLFGASTNVEDRCYKPFHVVDGQQRLTTFVIFIEVKSFQTLNFLKTDLYISLLFMTRKN
jgi:hypothetical protein